MLIASLLAIIVFAEIWKNWIKTIFVFSIFLIIDLVFFGANIIKVPHGGWFPLLIGIILLILMTTWSYGAWTGAGARDGASRILVSTVTHLMSSKLNDFSSPPSDSRCDLRRLLSAKPSCFLLLPFAPSPRLLITAAMGQPLHSQPIRLSFF